jgi:hypothetical protein
MATLWQGSVAPGLGQSFGEGINQSVNEGLNYLAQKKMMQLQGSHAAREREALRQETAQGWEGILRKEGAQAISKLSPQIQAFIAQNPKAISLLQGMAKQQGGNGMNALSGLQGMQGQQQQPDMERSRAIQEMASKAGITPEQIALGLNPFGKQPSIPQEEARFAQQKLNKNIEQQPQQQQQPQNDMDAQRIAEAFTPEPVRQAREKLSLQRYQTFQPKFNQIEQEGKVARSVKYTASEALNIVKTRLAKTGIQGVFTHQYLQTPEGQELQSLLGKLVLQNANLTKGVPSLGKLKMEEGAKAAIWQHPKTIENILERTINDPEINRDESRDSAREELLQQYGANIPDDILPKIEARSRELMKQGESKRLKQQEEQSRSSEIMNKYVAPAVTINGQPHLWVQGEGYVPAVYENEG